MPLTEEQRAALKRVVAYMDEMYAIASPYHGCTEDANILRAMIDSSEHIREPPKMIGFDLEKNRAAIDSAINSLLCEGWDNEASTVRRLVAEIERLRADYDKLKSSLLVIDGCKKLMNQAARIDELEADNQNLVTLNKSLMNNDWILRDNNRKYRKRAQKAELLNKELKADLEQSERVVEARLDVIDQQAAKIRELEDAHKRSGTKYAKIINELRSSVYANIPGLKKQWDEILNAPANGKIGPDDSKKISYLRPYEVVAADLAGMLAKSWQITEEREAAIMETIDLLNGDLFRSPYSDVLAVLRGMLTEADHDKP